MALVPVALYAAVVASLLLSTDASELCDSAWAVALCAACGLAPASVAGPVIANARRHHRTDAIAYLLLWTPLALGTFALGLGVVFGGGHCGE